jgi:hypothetical protein
VPQATDGLIRKYLKDKARQRVVADRGMADGDVAIVDMEVKREGERTPLPGLKKDGFFFDTEEDPLGGWWPGCLLTCLPAYLLTCLPACLLACLPACLLACLPAAWPEAGRVA